MDRKVYEFISKQTGDPIVERKTCVVSGEPFAIFQSDLVFYEKISPIYNGKKYVIPTPTLCPQERQRRRMAWRNERKFYKRKCDATGKDIISVHSDGYRVYDQEYRWSDKRDPMDFKIDFDSSINFFSQRESLLKNAPMGIKTVNSENSEYMMYGTNNKDCYLSSCVSYCESCYYGRFVFRSNDCIDNVYVVDSNLCYECIDVSNCNILYFCSNCADCSESYFLDNCTNCNKCFACVNMNNKSYCIHNKQYSKEEYDTQMEHMKPHTRQDIDEIKNHVKDMKKLLPVKNLSMKGSEQCIGNNITNSNNCVWCFDMFDTKDSKYIDDAGSMRDVMDASFVGFDTELGYEVTSSEQLHNACFSLGGINVKNVYYSFICINCENCFGCISLRDKQYYIFNKQYTKAEYDELVPKIIENMQQNGERGEFFPMAMSQFGYNETIAQEYFPLTRDEALARGYKRSDYKAPFPKTDASDVIICEVSGKPFRLIPQELEFYKKHNLPLPTKHPDVRHMERVSMRPGRELNLQTCDKCGIEMLSVYTPESKFKVYCEACYNKEIYG